MSDIHLHKYIPAVILVLLLGISFLVTRQPTKDRQEGIVYDAGEESGTGEVITDSHMEEDESFETTSFVKVYVCGSVLYPDVYELQKGSRIKDAVEMAGGFTEDAVDEALNLAEFIEDGQRIYVPCTAEADAGMFMQEDESQAPGLVNINRADVDELMTLPGIGEAKAKNIIKYRESNGNFDSIEALKNVDGIKEGVYAALSDLITVD